MTRFYYFKTNGDHFMSQSYGSLTACRKAAREYARSHRRYVAIRRGDGLYVASYEADGKPTLLP